MPFIDQHRVCTMRLVVNVGVRRQCRLKSQEKSGENVRRDLHRQGHRPNQGEAKRLFKFVEIMEALLMGMPKHSPTLILWLGAIAAMTGSASKLIEQRRGEADCSSTRTAETRRTRSYQPQLIRC